MDNDHFPTGFDYRLHFRISNSPTDVDTSLAAKLLAAHAHVHVTSTK